MDLLPRVKLKQFGLNRYSMWIKSFKHFKFWSIRDYPISANEAVSTLYQSLYRESQWVRQNFQNL